MNNETFTVRVEISIGGLATISEKFTGSCNNAIDYMRQYKSFYTEGFKYDGEYNIAESIRLDGDQHF